MEIQSDVYSYGLEWDYDEPLGVHVIETDDGTVLFGAGTEETGDDLADIALEHGVDAVVVEHGDVDHYAGVPALRSAIDDIEVAVPAGDASFLTEAGIDVDRHLDAGERFRGVETIAVPGHTPDNMAYRYDDVLVAGDTVVGAASLFAADDDWTGPLAACTPDFNADDEQTRASISTLADSDFDVVLLTHGENVTEGGREAVETLIADLE